MKKPLIVICIFFICILALQEFHRESIVSAYEETTKRLKDDIDRLREEKALARVNFVLNEVIPGETRAQAMMRATQLSIGELQGVERGIVENVTLKGFIDSVLYMKDSLDMVIRVAKDFDSVLGKQPTKQRNQN